MKGLSTSLVVVITAIVILVVALVVLTIFGVGVGQVGSIAEAETQCISIATSACKTAGDLPPNWDAIVFDTPDGPIKCNAVVQGCTPAGDPIY